MTAPGTVQKNAMLRHVTSLPGVLIPDITDADALHKQTMGLYASTVLPGAPGERRAGANILWRVEPGGVTVYSDLPASDVPEGARTYTLTSTHRTGDRVTFMATVDATVRVRGREFPAEDPGTWFEKRVEGALHDVRIISFNELHARRRGARLTQVDMHGTAVVTDAAALDVLLQSGVGRSKAFGCGAMEVGVIPINPNLNA